MKVKGVAGRELEEEEDGDEEERPKECCDCPADEGMRDHTVPIFLF